MSERQLTDTGDAQQPRPIMEFCHEPSSEWQQLYYEESGEDSRVVEGLYALARFAVTGGWASPADSRQPTNGAI